MIYEKDGVQMSVDGISARAFARNGWKPVEKVVKPAPVIEEVMGAVVSPEKEEQPKQVIPKSKGGRPRKK